MDTNNRLIEAVRNWAVSRKYTEATISETLSCTRALLRLREKEIDKIFASTVLRFRPILARLAVALEEVPEDVRQDLGALIEYGRGLVPEPKPNARFGGRAARRRSQDREARSIEDDAWVRLVSLICADKSRPARVLEVMARTGLRVGDVLRLSRAALAKARETGRVTILVKGRKEVNAVLEGAEDAWGKLIDGVLATKAPDVARWVSPGCRTEIHGAHGPYQAVRRLLQRLSREAGITEEVWTHRLRRTVGVRAYRATKDVLAVRDLLHHESAKTTYGYLSENREERVAEIQKKIREAL